MVSVGSADSRTLVITRAVSLLALLECRRYEKETPAKASPVAASRGQLKRAEDSYGKARQIGQRLQIKELEAGALNEQAWILALFQESKSAMENANAALSTSLDYIVKLQAAGALALAGDYKKAIDLAAEVARARLGATLVQSVKRAVHPGYRSIKWQRCFQGHRAAELSLAFTHS